MLNFTLETERLHLRPFSQDDLADFHAYAKVPGVGERAGWPHHQTLEESQGVLEAFMHARDVFAVVLKETNQVIGSIGLHQETSTIELKRAKLGYVLAQPFWRQGLMSEAAKTFVDAVFERHLCDVLEVSHFIENKPSRRIIETLGFMHEHDGEYVSKALNQRFPARFYSLDRDTYLKRKQL